MSVSLDKDKKQRRNKQDKKQLQANSGTMSGAAEKQQLEHYARVLDEGDRSALPAAMREVSGFFRCVFLS
jgi:hypothetical protein